MPLYNSAVYMPDLGLPAGVILVYSPHALAEAEREQERGIHLLAWLPRKLSLRCVAIVEATVVSKVVLKLVLRYTLPGTEFDLCLVIEPTRSEKWKVITVWANRSDDVHSTLNTRQFATT